MSIKYGFDALVNLQELEVEIEGVHAGKVFMKIFYKMTDRLTGNIVWYLFKMYSFPILCGCWSLFENSLSAKVVQQWHPIRPVFMVQDSVSWIPFSDDVWVCYMGYLRPWDTTYFINPQRSIQAGEDVIKIEGPPCTWDCCCQVTFNLYKAEDEDEMKVVNSSLQCIVQFQIGEISNAFFIAPSDWWDF